MNMISVAAGVFLDVGYTRTQRVWWGRYVDVDGNQIGSAWFDCSRDYVLIFRPEPEIERTWAGSALV